MADLPYMPLWTDAYLSDTRHLSTEEHGAYLLLLMCAWRSPGQRLPDDDHKLANMTGLTKYKWLKYKPSIMALWTLENGWWTQKRLGVEFEKSKNLLRQKREAASKGGKAKALKDKESRLAGAKPPPRSRHAIHNHNHMDIDPTIERDSQRCAANGDRSGWDFSSPSEWMAFVDAWKPDSQSDMNQLMPYKRWAIKHLKTRTQEALEKGWITWRRNHT